MLESLLTSLLGQTDSIASLPIATHVIAVLGLGCGIVLWLVGQRVLKPAFGLLGALLGGLVGFMTLPNIAPETIVGIPSPYAGLGIGAAFGLGAGLLLFRFALAISTALALGLAGTLIGAAAIHFAPMQDAARNLGTLKAEASQAASAPVDPTITKKSDIAVARARPVAKVVKEFVEKRAEEIRGAWNQLVARDQVLLALSGVGGLAAGFFIGLFFPSKSAALSTALVGSAVWIPSVVWIVHALEVPGRQHLDRSTLFWLIVWCVIATIGLIVQITGERRKGATAEN